jgi:O-antigen ligase
MRWFAVVCLIISIKILFETVYYGLDASRAAGLTSGLQEVLFPVAILLLALMRSGLESTQRDITIGMAVYPAIVVAGYLPFEVSQGLLQAAWFESSEFALGAVDTINSAHILAYGAVALALVYLFPRRRWTVTVLVAPCMAVVLVALTILTGNRQFVLALIGFLLLWAFFLQGSGRTRWLISITALAGLAYVIGSVVVSRHLALKERVSAQGLQDEAAGGRGVIWARAYDEMLDHLVLGTGYKNFGELIETVDRHGDPVILRDSAHGAFQDVFTEHGVFLGAAFLAGCMQLIVRTFRVILKERKTVTVGKAVTAGFLALLIPLPFSSAFLNATPVFLLLVMSLAGDSESLGDRQTPWEGLRARGLQLARIPDRRVGRL